MKKTKYFKLRLTPEELTSLKKQADGFSSVTHFVKEAIKEFSGQSPKQRIEMRSKVAQYFSSIDVHLAHMGGNLNQAMHRCNEASKAGIPVGTILMNDVVPKVQDCHAMLIEIRKVLYSLSTDAVKQ